MLNRECQFDFGSTGANSDEIESSATRKHALEQGWPRGNTAFYGAYRLCMFGGTGKIADWRLRAGVDRQQIKVDQ